jgi:hypothetical protein
LVELAGVRVARCLGKGLLAFKGVALAQRDTALVASLTTTMRALFSKRASVGKAAALSCAVVSTLTTAK